MSDGMNTVILMNTVLGYECSVDEAITIETMMFKNMRSEITRLTTELELAHKYRTEISTELTAYMVACENIKGQLSGERVRAEQAEKELAETRAELARYKQGVEVDGLVAYENYPWPIRILDTTALEKFHHECVRVLIMKVEE